MARGPAMEKCGKAKGFTTDIELRYATDINPKLEQWRALGAEWLTTLMKGKSTAMGAIKKFLMDYVHANGLAIDPAEFLHTGYRAPCFYESCLSHLTCIDDARRTYRTVSRFIDYVLRYHFSVEDDFGRKASPEFRNPIPQLPERVAGPRRLYERFEKTNKNPLPYRYIQKLRSILCPMDAQHFADWTWAQASGDAGRRGLDWFIVASEWIDMLDPDCVWRCRETTEYERDKYGYGNTVHELWSPARAVALYLKLELPLGSYQVRMLDSGEADTWRYEKGRWVRNTGPLAKGTERNPYSRGVFRRMKDDYTGAEITGLYTDTNKVANWERKLWNKGYRVPWQREKVLYWMEKLREWQSMYNPIQARTPWTSLEPKHIGKVKSGFTLKEMGSTCFLFRDAAAEGDDRFKPIAEKALEPIWYKLLAELENHCEVQGERGLSGTKLRFSRANTRATTYYPLHSLRVSLIKALIDSL